MDELHHECGVAALYYLPGRADRSSVWTGDPDQFSRQMPRMLLDLQNRGQLAAGMATYNPERDKLVDTYKDALPLDVRALFNFVADREFDAVHTLLRRPVEAPLARGVGRYFDAFGALFLGRRSTTFEGQLALEWNQAAHPLVADTYPFDIHDHGEIFELDLRGALRRALRDRAAGESTGTIAAAFHNTLAAATAALVRKVVWREGRFPIVASGGCFQNARLAEGVRAALAPELEIFLHESVPPGDGGIALGQAVIANANVRS